MKASTATYIVPDFIPTKMLKLTPFVLKPYGLTLEELAALLGVTVAVLRAWDECGEVSTGAVGGCFEVLRLIAESGKSREIDLDALARRGRINFWATLYAKALECLNSGLVPDGERGLRVQPRPVEPRMTEKESLKVRKAARKRKAGRKRAKRSKDRARTARIRRSCQKSLERLRSRLASTAEG